MKKIVFSFVLLFVLTLNTFADGIIHGGGFADEGDIHTGGKSYPQNQTCLVQTEQTESDSDDTIFSAVKSFLDLIF